MTRPAYSLTQFDVARNSPHRYKLILSIIATSRGVSIMSDENKPTWQELARKACNEKDTDKLIAITQDLIRALSEEQARRRHSSN
jgi:hypothetical protein